jgi:hypothetical protein
MNAYECRRKLGPRTKSFSIFNSTRKALPHMTSNVFGASRFPILLVNPLSTR